MSLYNVTLLTLLFIAFYAVGYAHCYHRRRRENFEWYYKGQKEGFETARSIYSEEKITRIPWSVEAKEREICRLLELTCFSSNPFGDRRMGRRYPPKSDGFGYEPFHKD